MIIIKWLLLLLTNWNWVFDMITDSDIKEITECFVEVVNKTDELGSIAKSYKDDRSLAMQIAGTKIDTGFIIDDGKLRMLKLVDKPTVRVVMDKNVYWDILNSSNSGLARAKIFTCIFTEESIKVYPPPGVGGGMLHIENIVQIFDIIAKQVMG